jgi:hypothetical protein
MELSNLARVYQLQGRYNEAEPLYRRTLAINEKILGPNHPRLALSLNSYADLLRKTGRKREAARLEKRARAILVITSEQYRNLPVDVHALPAIATGSGRLFALNLIPLATAATAAADNQERMLFVYLHDRHLVDSATLAGAKPIVARMFAEIGVRVQWRTGDPRPQLEQGCGRRSVGVRFAAQSQHTNVDATVLASTLPYTAGVPITILLGQLSPLSRSKPSHARALLAHVLVHEISHALGINRHSESGVMRAFWSDDEKNQMVERPLAFTPDEVEAIDRGMGKIGATGCADLRQAAQ